MTAYNVLIDFEVDRDPEVIHGEFGHAIHVETIGVNQYQVGFGVEAPNVGEAYRRGVAGVEATLLMLGVTAPAILSGNVHGPDGGATFD